MTPLKSILFMICEHNPTWIWLNNTFIQWNHTIIGNNNHGCRYSIKFDPPYLFMCVVIGHVTLCSRSDLRPRQIVFVYLINSLVDVIFIPTLIIFYGASEMHGIVFILSVNQETWNIVFYYKYGQQLNSHCSLSEPVNLYKFHAKSFLIQNTYRGDILVLMIVIIIVLTSMNYI